MQNLKLKLISIIGIFFMVSCLLGISVSAANDEMVIVKQNESEYIIYLKNYLDDEFEFAFSNNKEEAVENLSFINSALDANSEDANNIAYVDENTVSIFESTAYMWIKRGETIEVSAREININDNISKDALKSVGNISRMMPIKLEQQVVEDTVTENGLKKTTIVGIVKIENEYSNLKYQLIKRPTEGTDNELFALAEIIEKNDFTDVYTKVKAHKEFIRLCVQQFGELNEADWKNVENNIVYQPQDTQTGEQFILWLKADNNNDVHFFTSYREEDEKWIKEEFKQILPYTYDSNVYLIAFVIVTIAAVACTTRIVVLKKKELRK